MKSIVVKAFKKETFWSRYPDFFSWLDVNDGKNVSCFFSPKADQEYLCHMTEKGELLSVVAFSITYPEGESRSLRLNLNAIVVKPGFRRKKLTPSIIDSLEGVTEMALASCDAGKVVEVDLCCVPTNRRAISFDERLRERIDSLNDHLG